MNRWGMTYPLEGISLSEHKEVLQAAEDLGYTDAWSAEVNANDAFTPLAAFAAWTKTTRLGCAIANIYTRTPTLLAQTASAVADLAPGRFCLGIGTSSPAIVENWNGARLEEPLKRMRETITFLRRRAGHARAAAYAELQKLVRDEAPWVFLWQQHDLYGVASHIEWTPRADEKVWMYDAKIVAR